MPIRLVLAEDHYLVREGVRSLLDAEPGFEVAAVCGDFDSLLAAVGRERPNVVVTDIRMPPGHSDEGDPGREATSRNEPRRRRGRSEPLRGPELCARSARRAARDAPTC